MPPLGDGNGTFARICRFRAYLPGSIPRESDFLIFEADGKRVPDRPKSLTVERRFRQWSDAEQGSCGLRREMENQGSLGGYVLRSLMGRRHQAGEACPSQAASRFKTSGHRCCISTGDPSCRDCTLFGYSCRRPIDSCSGLGGSARKQIKLTRYIY